MKRNEIRRLLAEWQRMGAVAEHVRLMELRARENDQYRGALHRDLKVSRSVNASVSRELGRLQTELNTSEECRRGLESSLEDYRAKCMQQREILVLMQHYLERCIGQDIDPVLSTDVHRLLQETATINISGPNWPTQSSMASNLTSMGWVPSGHISWRNSRGEVVKGTYAACQKEAGLEVKSSPEPKGDTCSD